MTGKVLIILKRNVPIFQFLVILYNFWNNRKTYIVDKRNVGSDRNTNVWSKISSFVLYHVYYRVWY